MFSFEFDTIDNPDTLFKDRPVNRLKDHRDPHGDTYLVHAVKESNIKYIEYYYERGVKMSGQN